MGAKQNTKLNENKSGFSAIGSYLLIFLLEKLRPSSAKCSVYLAREQSTSTLDGK